MGTLTEARTKDEKREFARRAAWTSLFLLGLLALPQLPGHLRQWKAVRHLGPLVFAMANNEMSHEDVDALVNGYYEGLHPNAWQAGLPGERDDIQFRKDFLRYELKPNLKRPYQAGMRITNSLGMANPEYSYAKPPHTRRIAVFGDSLSLGPYGKDYLAQLEARLNQNCRTSDVEQYQILNFAVYGYSIVQSMDAALTKAPQFHPDVYVVAMSNLETMETEGWRTHVGSLLAGGTDLKYDYLRQVLAQAGVQPSTRLVALRRKLQPYFIPVTLWALDQVRDHARMQGAQMMIFMIPAPISPDLVASDFRYLHKAADQAGVPVIDLRNAFRSANLDEVRVDPTKDIHPNALGHTLIADSLFSGMEAQPAAWTALAGHPCEIAASASAQGR